MSPHSSKLFSTYLSLLPDSLLLLNIFFLAFSLVNFFYPIFFNPQSTFFLLHILALLPYIFLFLFLTCASRIFSFRLLVDFLRDKSPVAVLAAHPPPTIAVAAAVSMTITGGQSGGMRKPACSHIYTRTPSLQRCANI
jgi:hypothetical protein